jgi:hypothetical protein
MSKLTLTKQEAINLFRDSNEKGQKLLVDKFGLETFNKNWKDIKSFEDACEDQGVEPETIIPFKSPVNADQKSINAHAKLIVICRAINENKEPNWDDSNEAKYYPYFDMRSGVGFSFSLSDVWYTRTGVGSRLSFRTREKAEYAANQFLDIYKEFIK